MGAALLLGAAVIWGFAFIPQKMTVMALPPWSATALRFCLAAPAALVVSLLLGRPGAPWKRVPVARGIVLGVMLLGAYVLQTAALVYAPVARVSLVTGMYAVFVPLFAPLLGHARPTGAHWLGAIVALLGLLGLVGVMGDAAALSVPLNVGDILVLGHALISAFQVLLVARLAAGSDAYALNAIQLTAVAVLALPTALLVDGAGTLDAITGLDAATWRAFGYLAAFSTVVAFIFQFIGQRHTSAPTAAVLMLIETPVAVVAAVVLLGEQMGIAQWVGAGVLLGGVGLSLWPELSRGVAAAPPADGSAPPPRS